MPTTADASAPSPLPELEEPKLGDPGLTDLSWRDWGAIFVRAGKEAIDDKVPMVASALAYSSFLAIPSILLITLGLFTIFSSPETIRDLMDRLGTVMPTEATQLLGDSLTRLEARPATSISLVVVGFALAIWGATGAMTVYMDALNTAFDRDDDRSFGRKRLVALALAGVLAVAVALVGILLIFGPFLENWIGEALGIETVLGWLWWGLQWPILVAGLLAVFAVLHYFAPDVSHRSWKFVTPGALVSALAWLAASGGFAVYTSLFSSYNKAWGSLSAVIVTLTWLWLTGLALLYGGEVNAEVERSRRMRAGGAATLASSSAPRHGE